VAHTSTAERLQCPRVSHGWPHQSTRSHSLFRLIDHRVGHHGARAVLLPALASNRIFGLDRKICRCALTLEQREQSAFAAGCCGGGTGIRSSLAPITPPTNRQVVPPARPRTPPATPLQIWGGCFLSSETVSEPKPVQLVLLAFVGEISVRRCNVRQATARPTPCGGGGGEAAGRQGCLCNCPAPRSCVTLSRSCLYNGTMTHAARITTCQPFAAPTSIGLPSNTLVVVHLY